MYVILTLGFIIEYNMIVHACISIGVGFGFRGVPLTLNLSLEETS